MHRRLDVANGVQLQSAGAPTLAIYSHQEHLLISSIRDHTKRVNTIIHTSDNNLRMLKANGEHVRLPPQGAALQLALLALESVGINAETYNWLHQPTDADIAAARTELNRLVSTDAQRVRSSASHALTAKLSLALGLAPEHAALIVNGALATRTPVGLYVAVAMQFAALSSPLSAPFSSGTKLSSQLVADNNDVDKESAVMPSRPMPSVSTVGDKDGAKTKITANNRAACVPLDACVRAIAAWQSDRSPQARQYVCDDTGLSQAYMLAADAWLTSLLNAMNGFFASNFAANGNTNERVLSVVKALKRPIAMNSIACETTMGELMHHSVLEVFRPRLIHRFETVFTGPDAPTATHASFVDPTTHAMFLDARPHVPGLVGAPLAAKATAVYNMGAVGVGGQWLLSPPALSLPMVNNVQSKRSRGEAAFAPMQPGILAHLFPDEESVTKLSTEVGCTLKLDAEGVCVLHTDTKVRSRALNTLLKFAEHAALVCLTDVLQFGMTVNSVALCGEGMAVNDVACAGEKTTVVLSNVPERFARSEDLFIKLFISELGLESAVAHITIKEVTPAAPCARVKACQLRRRKAKQHTPEGVDNSSTSESEDDADDDSDDDEDDAIADVHPEQQINAPVVNAAKAGPPMAGGDIDDDLARAIALSLEEAKQNSEPEKRYDVTVMFKSVESAQNAFDMLRDYYRVTSDEQIRVKLQTNIADAKYKMQSHSKQLLDFSNDKRYVQGVWTRQLSFFRV